MSNNLFFFSCPIVGVFYDICTIPGGLRVEMLLLAVIRQRGGEISRQTILHYFAVSLLSTELWWKKCYF